MPFYQFIIRVSNEALKSLILKQKGWNKKPKTLGDHLRNERLELGFSQPEVARQLGTTREVYERWERDVRVPVISEWARILAHLRRYPAVVTTPTDLVLKARRVLGLDQKRMARRVRVDDDRLRRWEHGTEIPCSLGLLKLHRLITESEASPP